MIGRIRTFPDYAHRLRFARESGYVESPMAVKEPLPAGTERKALLDYKNAFD